MCSRGVVWFQGVTNGIFKYYLERNDLLCGLVVTAPGYRSRGPGSIPGSTRFLRSSGSGTGPTESSEYKWSS
jgi:hypothetical protein